mgnify:CR=1 FL=1
MTEVFSIFADPAVWAALFALVIMEVVLGIDNLIFISILSNKLPPEQQGKARKLGIGLALGLRLLLLSGIAWLVGLTQPVIDLGITGTPGSHGEPTFETAFSWRDIILITGGLFLVWKATKEIHHNLDTEESGALLDKKGSKVVSFGAVIVQILLLDMVFSIDSDGRGHDRSFAGHGDCRDRCGNGDVAGRRSPGHVHRKEPDGRHAGFGFPAHDRFRTHCRRLWRARAERVYLCRDGVFGLRRNAQHRQPTPSDEQGRG